LDACEDSGVVQRLVDSGIRNVRMYVKSSTGGNVTFSLPLHGVFHLLPNHDRIHMYEICVWSIKCLETRCRFSLWKAWNQCHLRQDCRCAAILCQNLLKHVLILFQYVKDSMHQGTQWGSQLVWSCTHQTQGGSREKHQIVANSAFLLYYVLWN
jgi:hypothetical protein